MNNGLSEEQIKEKLVEAVANAGNVNQLALAWGINRVSIYNALKGVDSAGRKTGVGRVIAEKLGYPRCVERSVFEYFRK